MTKTEYHRLMSERANVISHNRSIRMSNRGGKLKEVPPMPEGPMVWQASNDNGYVGTFSIGGSQTEAEQELKAWGFDLDKIRFKRIKAN